MDTKGQTGCIAGLVKPALCPCAAARAVRIASEMPHVVHVLRKFEPAEWGGTETHICGLIPELRRFGFTSEVHAPREAGTDGSALEALGAKFHSFKATYPYLGLNQGERAKLVASGGNLVSVGEFGRLLKDRSASLVHVHTQGRLGGVVRTACRVRGMPYAVTVHSPVKTSQDIMRRAKVGVLDRPRLDFGKPFGALVGARNVGRDADLFFTLNDAEHAAWLDTRLGKHVEQISHGVQMQRSSERARAAARALIPGVGDDPFILVLGRVDPVKGQDLALRAYLSQKGPRAHLVLAGSVTDPDFDGSVRRLSAERPSHVHFLEGVAPDIARALLAEAMLALVPSRAEAFGLVLLEAWAEGTPALFSNVGGLRGISERAGLTFGQVEPTVEAWTLALKEALGRESWLVQESKEGPLRVRRDYSWRAVAERIARAYRRALAES